MAANTEKSEQKEQIVTFRCKFCKKALPLDEMSIITKYFPPIVACKACEKALQ